MIRIAQARDSRAVTEFQRVLQRRYPSSASIGKSSDKPRWCALQIFRSPTRSRPAAALPRQDRPSPGQSGSGLPILDLSRASAAALRTAPCESAEHPSKIRSRLLFFLILPSASMLARRTMMSESRTSLLSGSPPVILYLFERRGSCR